MATPATLDVWIVDSNTVYKAVPYGVVSDWVQQGRLLDDDRVRPAGASDWQRVAELATLTAYQVKVEAEPVRAEDQAEALEPVETGFVYSRRSIEQEEEDVDMVPLIDVSLVLLIFFMMTATVSSAASTILTPNAYEGVNILGGQRNYWIGIDKNSDGQTVYSLGQGEKGPEKEHTGLSEAAVLAVLDDKLKEQEPVEVRVRAHRDLPYEVVRHMTLALERRRATPISKHGVRKIYAEVSEREQR
jgi:biopolymer transport protein ExbD